MESYIAITKLNDFTYSPKSLYFSTCYSQFDHCTFDDTPQIKGRQAHDKIQSQYAAKNIYKDKWVYEENLGIYGKIDIYDKYKKLLVERKNLIKTVYIGYKIQVYAQYYSLISMGFKIDKIILFSIKDNKEYILPFPNLEFYNYLQTLCQSLREYNVNKLLTIEADVIKDNNTIYNNLFF